MYRPDILDPGAIADDVPLIDSSLCLDSLDALELAICVEEEFGVAIHTGTESGKAFASFASLAAFLCAHGPADAARPAIAVDFRLPRILPAGWAL